MQVFHSPGDVHRFVCQHRAAGQTVGLVPTMGALHEGHLSLARHSAAECDITVATIFVNPTQFGPSEDLDQYPRTLPEDCRLLESEHVTAVFVPDSNSMYPPGFSTYVQPPEIARSLEGVCRPDHFRGVTTVVMKLFQILPASHAFFGRKDYQQWKVIEAMARDLNVPIQIVSCPTVREADGLAISSRNRYLTEQQRDRAGLLSTALQKVQQLVDGGEQKVDQLQIAMRQVLTASDQAGLGVDKIDYADVVDAETLAPLDQFNGRAVALIAAHVGTTRLIDNAILEV
jgi:pantoate--beta-alanine ligase